ncbi:MAG: arylsulfatase, partial [Caulobacteraceae bacterium]
GVAVRNEGGARHVALLIDGAAAGGGSTPLGFHNFISWSGLDIGRDRGSPVADYAAPFAFTGRLEKVTVTMDAVQSLDGEAVGEAEMARQ